MMVRSTDGVALAVHDLGGDGPPMLLAHATGFCGAVWNPLVETLARRFRCLAVDFRAHGHSTRPAGPLNWDGMADDVLAVVDGLGFDRPVAAAGHSMGGAALALAEDRRPGTLRAIWSFEPILIEHTADIVGRQPSPISEATRRRRDTFGSRAEVIERYGSRPPLDRLDRRALQAYVDHGFEDRPGGTVTLRCRPEDEAEVFERHHTDAPGAVARIRCPQRMAIGGDRELPAQACREAAAANPHIELVVHDDLGHLGPLEDPDRVAGDILAWLSD